jgi:hypothetical protein
MDVIAVAQLFLNSKQRLVPNFCLINKFIMHGIKLFVVLNVY